MERCTVNALLDQAPGCLAPLAAGAGAEAPAALLVFGLLLLIVFVIAIGAGVLFLTKTRPGVEQAQRTPGPLPPGFEPPAPDVPADPVERHRQVTALENAARCEACRLARELGDAPGARLWLLAGPDSSGALALAIARHLDSFGCDLTVQQLAPRERLWPDAEREMNALAAARVRLIESHTPRPLPQVIRLLVGVRPETLADARRQALTAIAGSARAQGVPLEELPGFNALFTPPRPEPGDLALPAPEAELRREDVRLLDSLAIQSYHIPGAALMENAGCGAAREAWRMARADAADREHRAVAVVCGRGNNGGDGLVVARHLFNWGLSPGVFLLGQKDKLTDDAASNLALLEREGLKVTPLFDESQWPMLEAALSQAGLVVDAVLGTGMTGVVRGQAAQAIEMINAARGRGAKVLALDCPSGLDCNTGEPLGACVEADETVTFGARKVGFRCGQAPRLCGRVTLVSIGLPRDLYRRHTPAPK